MNRTFFLLVLLLLPGETLPVYKQLSEKEIAEAVAFGKQWKNSNKFLEEGLKPYNFQIDSAMSWDGISKHVKFYTDWTLVAASAVVANRQMRDLSAAEIEQIPKSGLLVAVVELHARGLVPVGKLERRFTEGNTHLVLKIGEKVIQPSGIETVSDYFYRTWQTIGGIFTPPTGVIPHEERKIVLKFAYDLDEEQMKSKVSAILLDADGKQRKVEVDLSKLK